MQEDKPFSKPLGKWIEEDQKVDRVVQSFDPTTKKVTEEIVTDTQKVKVMYEKTILDSVFCNDFTHEFIVIDSHKYIIKCKKCPLHKHIMVGQEYIDSNGNVRLRSNDMVIA